MRGFSLLSRGFGKSLVEHWRSWISTGRQHLSSVASGAGKSSGCYHPIPLAVKKASVVGFECEKMAGCVWSTPKGFFFLFFLKGPPSSKNVWIKTNGFGKESTMQVYYDNSH